MSEPRKFDFIQANLANLGAVGSINAVPTTAATLAVTKATHAGRVIALGTTACTCTLPASTGGGDTYTFIVKTAAAHVVKVANATDVMSGSVNLQQDTDSAGTLKMWLAATSDDTITFAGIATTGGIQGARITCTDYSLGFWSCVVFSSSGGGSEATPFSATVS